MTNGDYLNPRALARHRGAYLGTEPMELRPGTYYSGDGEEGYPIRDAR